MFDKLQSAIEAAPVMPETGLRLQAATLLTTVQTSIREGDWVVNPANDPMGAVDRLGETLGSTALDVFVAARTLDLVDHCVPAIAEGQWTIGAMELEAVFDASVAAGAFPPVVAEDAAPKANAA